MRQPLNICIDRSSEHAVKTLWLQWNKTQQNRLRILWLTVQTQPRSKCTDYITMTSQWAQWRLISWSNKTSKFRVAGLWEENSPETSDFPAQRASNAGNVSIWWRHHEYCSTMLCPIFYFTACEWKLLIKNVVPRLTKLVLVFNSNIANMDFRDETATGYQHLSVVLTIAISSDCQSISEFG